LPAKGDFDRETAIHWDAKPRERIRDPVPSLQGMIFLTDTVEPRHRHHAAPLVALPTTRTVFAAMGVIITSVSAVIYGKAI